VMGMWERFLDVVLGTSKTGAESAEMADGRRTIDDTDTKDDKSMGNIKYPQSLFFTTAARDAIRSAQAEAVIQACMDFSLPSPDFPTSLPTKENIELLLEPGVLDRVASVMVRQERQARVMSVLAATVSELRRLLEERDAGLAELRGDPDGDNADEDDLPAEDESEKVVTVTLPDGTTQDVTIDHSVDPGFNRVEIDDGVIVVNGETEE